MDYKQIITFWKEFNVPIALERNASVDINTDFIITITGPRRAGKTYFCFQLLLQLLPLKLRFGLP